MERGIEQSYEGGAARPSTISRSLLAWFGVVDDVKAVPGTNQVMVAMSLHFHQDRHLCTDQFDRLVPGHDLGEDRRPVQCAAGARTRGQDRP